MISYLLKVFSKHSSKFWLEHSYTLQGYLQPSSIPPNLCSCFLFMAFFPHYWAISIHTCPCYLSGTESAKIPWGWGEVRKLHCDSGEINGKEKLKQQNCRFTSCKNWFVTMLMSKFNSLEAKTRTIIFCK